MAISLGNSKIVALTRWIRCVLGEFTQRRYPDRFDSLFNVLFTMTTCSSVLGGAQSVYQSGLLRGRSDFSNVTLGFLI